jgi:3-dehydroquinate synthase
MKIDTQFSTLYISSEINKIIKQVLSENQFSKIFITVGENTKVHCLPKLTIEDQIKQAEIIETKSGENNKSIRTVEHIWKTLSEKGADRSSLLINLGGGLLCDLGGFAASTFKRGMDFINIPTTLLSQVDASAGGKTGFNFMGLKNEIGVFSHPKYVIIDSSFNRTLDHKNILSGWAEMLKHALIFDEKDWTTITGHEIRRIGFKELNQLIARSVNIKNHFVEQDPKERGIRKALNLGHTFGHAFESLFMKTETPVLHGEAVAHGLICELFLSSKLCGFAENKLKHIASYILKTYGKLDLESDLYDKIFDLMLHDKKNENAQINFTLLEDFGKIKINQKTKKADLIEALNWYINL